MSGRRLVIVAGLIASGKSTVADKLTQQGYESRSVGDELARLYRIKRGLSPEVAVTGLGRMAIHKQVRATDPTYFSRFILDGEADIVAEGLRNYNDACDVIKAGGCVLSLIAPLSIRVLRRLGSDTIKDPSLEALVTRELTELDDPDPDGSQALRVMALAHEHGAFIDASQPKDKVFSNVVTVLRTNGLLP